jgi:hypothetical protein
MKKLFLKLIVVSSMLWFCGCSVKTVQTLSSSSIKVCKMQCQEQFVQCQKVCDDACQSCEAQATEETKKRYEHYQEEKCLQGKAIVRRLQSYRDPLQCLKSSCDCNADRRVCVEACSGDIQKRVQVAEVCC